MMRVRIANERYDLSDYAAAAIKATYYTREPGGVERCIEALNHLKSLSFSVNDTQLFYESISKLETLRRHRNPKIRKDAHALFYSWMKTLYAQGRDNSSKACLTQFHEENDDERSHTLEAVASD
ncbi:hypothetical protein V5N11_013925 [Cardamine amara subsp. amara]|uniref:Transcription elongation factor TFIIS/CRSP70 N-terminal sub-type domain-containing protein n=1 Tax=Cardamine amara subsp. amara TaxID=228776 RepID=A0ABD1BH35_CARAN